MSISKISNSRQEKVEVLEALTEPNEVSEISSECETDPAFAEEQLPGDNQTNFDKSTITIALQMMPEDGNRNQEGRKVILIVKTEKVAQPIKLLSEADLGPLPELVQRLLQNLELEVNKPPQAKEPGGKATVTAKNQGDKRREEKAKAEPISRTEKWATKTVEVETEAEQTKSSNLPGLKQANLFDMI